MLNISKINTNGPFWPSSIRLPPTVLGLQTQQPRFLQNGLLLSSSMGLLVLLCPMLLLALFCFLFYCETVRLEPFKVFLFSERSVQSSDFRGSPEKTRVSDKSPHRHGVTDNGISSVSLSLFTPSLSQSVTLSNGGVWSKGFSL